MGLPAVPGLLLTLVLQALLVTEQPTGVTARYTVKKDSECPPGKYAHPKNKTICCTMCHKGTHLTAHCENSWMSTGCEPCAEGTFMDLQNFRPHCLSCSRCRTNLGQVEISACTAEQDTVCGCGPNKYRFYMGNLFRCENCNPCHNGSVRIVCNQDRDSVCDCVYGKFYLKNNKCEPCAKCNNNSDCVNSCSVSHLPAVVPEDRGTQEVLLPLVIFLGLCLLFLLFLLFLCCSPRWKSKLASIVCPKKLSTPIKEGEPDPGKFGPGPYPSFPTFTPIPTSTSPAPFTKSENWPHFGPPPEETAPPLLKADPTSSPTSCLLQKWEPGSPQQQRPDDPVMLYAVVDGVPPARWKEFVRRLGLSEHEIERLELQNGRCLREAQYSMLAAWRQRTPRHEASLELLGRVLCDMDLRGCLEGIQEAVGGPAPAPPSPRPPR